MVVGVQQRGGVPVQRAVLRGRVVGRVEVPEGEKRKGLNIVYVQVRSKYVQYMCAEFNSIHLQGYYLCYEIEHMH